MCRTVRPRALHALRSLRAHAHSKRLCWLCCRYCGRAHFALVYIAEAHASDQWPVGQSVSVCAAPRDLTARVALAARLCRERGVRAPVLVDDPAGDGFLERFAAWPVRFYGLELLGGGADEAAVSVPFAAQPHASDCNYHEDDLEDWLMARCAPPASAPAPSGCQ
jgi:hypothetical protein